MQAWNWNRRANGSTTLLTVGDEGALTGVFAADGTPTAWTSRSQVMPDHLDGASCQVFAEGVEAGLAERYLYPDAMVMRGKASAGEEQVIGNPKLVIEVLSASIKGDDRRDKFILNEYMTESTNRNRKDQAWAPHAHLPRG